MAPEEPTATTPKKWDGGSRPEGPPAAAAARDGAARAQGGAAEPRSGRAGFCPQRAPPSAKRGRRARLRGKADEGRGPPFRRDGAARIPKSADAIRREHNERQRGAQAATAPPTAAASIPHAPTVSAASYRHAAEVVALFIGPPLFPAFGVVVADVFDAQLLVFVLQHPVGRIALFCGVRRANRVTFGDPRTVRFRMAAPAERD